MADRSLPQLVRGQQPVSRAAVLANPCPVPRAPGVYGWWFASLPGSIPVSGCETLQGLTLLYVGISPRREPANGRPPSRQDLRGRIRAHFAGNAEGSTLRRTLGCLLAAELGIELRRVGSGGRMTFHTGESLLSAWMAENAYVSWVVDDRPWELEHELIGALDLPLNLQGNETNRFHPTLSTIRAEAFARARTLPILPNLGVGGR